MKFLKENIIPLFIYKRKKLPIVLYKIVDFKNGFYIIQCTSFKTILKHNLSEISSDIRILRGLHPLQACFIGIEYGIALKNDKHYSQFIKKCFNWTEYLTEDTGEFSFKYQDRKGLICYIDNNTNEEHISSPKDIAFTDHIISGFPSLQAFYIGLCAGIKFESQSNLYYLK